MDKRVKEIRKLLKRFDYLPNKRALYCFLEERDKNNILTLFLKDRFNLTPLGFSTSLKKYYFTRLTYKEILPIYQKIIKER